MPEELHLLFRLARELRYLALPELVGRRVRIDSLAHVRDALLAVARPFGATAWTPHERMELALTNYDLIDADLDVPPAVLDHAATRAGLDVMRENGFAPPLAERRELGPEACFCADELARDLDRPTAFLKLMLHAVDPPSPSVAAPRHRLADLPRGSFPREFEVVDACVTNASFVWMLKHFYL